MIDNMISKQNSVISNLQTSSTEPVNTPSTQPSWNDLQIHIASASGKSVSSYLHICDFVQSKRGGYFGGPWQTAL